MKHIAAGFILAVMCLCLNMQAADQQGSFTGTWVLDSKESDLAPIPVRDLNNGVVGRGMGGGMGGPGMGGPGMGGPGMGGPGTGSPGMGGSGSGGGATSGTGSGGGFQKPQPPTPLVIQQNETDMSIANTMKGMDGKDMPVTESFKLDQKELVEDVPVPNSKTPQKRVTKAALKNNEFQVSQTTSFPQGKSEVKKKYSLSKDGKTLTLKIKTTTTMSMNMPGGPPMPAMVTQTEQKLVYNRQ